MAVVKESAILNTPLIDGSSTKNKLVVSEFEKSLILKIFKKCGFEKSELQDCEIESINSNFLYESYSIVFDKKKYFNLGFIESGGWHFTNIMSPEKIDFKMRSFLHHLEYEESGFNIQKLKEKKACGKENVLYLIIVFL